MGAVTFSLDPRLVSAIRSGIHLDTFVETGTFLGDTLETFQKEFDNLISIELSRDLWVRAVQRFKPSSNIRIMQGNSACKLKELSSELQNIDVLYWLDAHWCESDATAGELSQCPLIDELKAIGPLTAQSVILIDDARLFLAPPLAPHEITQWPSFHQIVLELLSKSSEHEIMVVNDVIAYFPKSAKNSMQTYAQNYGVDWLTAANCLKENGHFMVGLREKEDVIGEISLALNAYKSALEGMTLRLESIEETHKAVLHEKDITIQQQRQAIRRYRLCLLPTEVLGRVKRIILSIIRPRLGNLSQYQPRQMKTRRMAKVKNTENLPLISVVTPSFRQGDFIERTLKSVLDQNYPKLEYFVQDGGSLDSTVEVLKRYQERLTGWVSAEDTGQSQAINLGLKKTTGEIMAWLNSDDLLLPGTLHAVADYFERNPEVDVVYGNRLLIDENDMEIGRWIMPGHDSEVLSWVDYVPQETMFWRRRIWNNVDERVDESFRFAMDWDLLVRFREVGAKFGHIPQFLGAFRIHEHQKTSAAINDIGHQEMDRIRKRVLGEIPSRKEIVKAITPYLIKHIAFDMTYRVKVKLGIKT